MKREREREICVHTTSAKLEGQRMEHHFCHGFLLMGMVSEIGTIQEINYTSIMVAEEGTIQPKWTEKIV